MIDIRYLFMLFLGIFLAVFTLHHLNSFISGEPLLVGFGITEFIHYLGGDLAVIAFDIVLVVLFVRYVLNTLRKDERKNDSHT